MCGICPGPVTFRNQLTFKNLICSGRPAVSLLLLLVSFLLLLSVGWDHALHGGSLAFSVKRFLSYFLSQ